MKLSIKYLLAAGVLSSALLTAQTASAVLIAYDGFDYSGTLNDGDSLGGANGGIGWTEAWQAPDNGAIVYDSPGQTYSGLQTTGGNVDWGTREGSSGRRMDATAGGTVDIASSGEAWFSFLIRVDVAQADFGGYRMLFFTGSASSSNGFGVDVTGSGNVTPRMIGNANFSGASSGALTFGDGTEGSGQTALIVGKLNYNGTETGDLDSTMELWLNPADFSSTGALGTASATHSRTAAQMNNGTFSFGNNTDAYLRTDANDLTDMVFIDEIRVGTELSDVTPIPEPGALMLLLVGGAAFLMRRRRAV